jgi:hypothetical protein
MGRVGAHLLQPPARGVRTWHPNTAGQLRLADIQRRDPGEDFLAVASLLQHPASLLADGQQHGCPQEPQGQAETDPRAQGNTEGPKRLPASDPILIVTKEKAGCWTRRTAFAQVRRGPEYPATSVPFSKSPLMDWRLLNVPIKGMATDLSSLWLMDGMIRALVSRDRRRFEVVQPGIEVPTECRGRGQITYARLQTVEVEPTKPVLSHVLMGWSIGQSVSVVE